MMSYSPNGVDPNQGMAEDAERVLCRRRLQPAIFTAFALSATAITFWYGGTKPGILAALISWLVRDHFFEPEVSAESRILYGLVFLFSALVMILTMRGRQPWGSPGGLPRLKTSIFG